MFFRFGFGGKRNWHIIGQQYTHNTGTTDGTGTNTGNGVADKNTQTGDSLLFVTLLAAACVAVVAVLTKKRLACKK